MIRAYILYKKDIVTISPCMSMCMWEYFLHSIIFVTEITLDKINHATNINLTQGIISVEHFVVYSSTCF